MLRYAAPGLLLLTCLQLSAQIDTSNTPKQEEILRTKVFFAQPYHTTAPDTIIHHPDTSLIHLHRFNRPQQHWTLPTGLTGQKYLDLTASNFTPLKPGFNLMRFNFPYLLLSTPDSSYTNRYHSMTDLSFLVGTGGEQYVSVFHVQNLNKYFSLFASGKKDYNDGLYPAQLADIGTGQAGINGSYRNLFLSAGLQFVKAQIQENGGIADTIDLEMFPGTEIQGIPVMLPNAYNRYNEFRAHAEIGYTLHFNDSVPSAPWLKPAIKIERQTVRNRYTDEFTTPAFYNNFFLDSLQSFDSIANLNWTLFPKISFGAGKFTGGAGVRLASFKYHILGTHKSYNRSVIANLGINPYTWLRLNLQGEYFTDGYNAGDYDYELQAQIPDSLWNIRLWFNLTRQQPTAVEQEYFSNHFIWTRDFNPVSTKAINAYFNYLPWNIELTASYRLFTNLVYFNEHATPSQFQNTTGIFAAGAEKIFRFGVIGFAPELLLQAPQSEIFRVPTLAARLNLFLEGAIFKKAMRVQAGFDALYTTSYKPYAYMPATQSFYLQHDFASPEYPLINAYLSLRVKTVRAFILSEHVLHGALGYDFRIMRNYPLPARTVRVGINWKFFN